MTTEYTPDQIRAAHESVWCSQNGDIVLADLRRHLDVFGADYLTDDVLAEIPHPYRGYVELGLQKALRRIEALAEAVRQGDTHSDEEDDDAPDET